MSSFNLTIVIPVFNKEAYIEGLIKMLEQQSVSPDEIIFVDDASSDNSLIVLRDTLSKSKLRPISKILSNECNEGPSKARNRGICAAKSSYVCMLDADDWWDPLFIETVNSFLSQGNIDLVGVGYDNMSEFKLGSNLKRCAKSKITRVNLEKFYKECFLRKIPYTCSSVVVKKQSFISIGGFCSSLKNGEDQVLWSEFCSNDRFNCVLIRDVLAHYRLEVVNSASKVSKDLSWLKFLFKMKRCKSFFCELYLLKLIVYFGIKTHYECLNRIRLWNLCLVFNRFSFRVLAYFYLTLQKWLKKAHSLSFNCW